MMTFSGKESIEAADSNACDKYFTGMAIKYYSDDDFQPFVVHAISREKGLITLEHSLVRRFQVKDNFMFVNQSVFRTFPCSSLEGKKYSVNIER
jgi:hypothetical protein